MQALPSQHDVFEEVFPDVVLAEFSRNRHDQNTVGEPDPHVVAEPLSKLEVSDACLERYCEPLDARARSLWVLPLVLYKRE